jgi:hypothetical protein
VKKKEVLDKHLDFLLSQTERYSKVLAEDLVKPTTSPRPATLDAAGSPAVAAAASPGASGVVPAASSTDDADAEFVMDAAQLEEEDDEDTMEAEEQIAAALGEAGAEAQAAELAALQAEQALPMDQLLARYKALEAAEFEPQTGEAGPSGQALTVDRSSCGSVPPPPPLPVDEEGGLEYSVAGEDSEDDEETLEAEEEIAAALGESIDPATERNLLDDEANLPIEELMRRYQQMAAEQGVAVPDDDPEPPVSSDDSDGEDEGTATLAEAPEAPGTFAPEDPHGKRPMGLVVAKAEAEHAEQAEEEREYRPTVDSDDDEETMANEEQLAEALGEAADPQVSLTPTSRPALVRLSLPAPSLYP